MDFIAGKVFFPGDMPRGGEGAAKMLHLRFGKLCFDSGDAGVLQGKTLVNDGQPHDVAVRYRLETDTFVLMVDGVEDGDAGLHGTPDHALAGWLSGLTISHETAAIDFLAASETADRRRRVTFCGEILEVRYQGRRV